MRYTRNELRALHLIFRYHADENDIDHDDENESNSDRPLYVYPAQTFSVISELSRSDEELSRMKIALTEFQEQQQSRRRDPSSSTAAHYRRVEAASDSSTIASRQSNLSEPKAVQIIADVPMGCVTFDSFAGIIDQGRQTQSGDNDESHMHFICIVNEYQTRCDSEGKYLLAKDFMENLACVCKEEEHRVVNEVKAKMASDRAKIVKAHEQQLVEFTQSWDYYLKGFEEKAEQHLMELKQTHKMQSDTLRKHLTDEIASKPKKWSKDLMDCRKSLANVAKQASTDRSSVPHAQLYREAQQIKQVTDTLHEREESDMSTKFNSVLSTKVRNLEMKQQAEMTALSKRIDTKRREVYRKREDDTLRLQHRNRNIVKMLDAKNKLECSKVAAEAQIRIKRVIKQYGRG